MDVINKMHNDVYSTYINIYFLPFKALQYLTYIKPSPFRQNLMRTRSKNSNLFSTEDVYVISDEVSVKLIILYLFLVMVGKEWLAFLP